MLERSPDMRGEVKIIDIVLWIGSLSYARRFIRNEVIFSKEPMDLSGTHKTLTEVFEMVCVGIAVAKDSTWCPHFYTDTKKIVVQFEI